MKQENFFGTVCFMISLFKQQTKKCPQNMKCSDFECPVLRWLLYFYVQLLDYSILLKARADELIIIIIIINVYFLLSKVLL